MFLITRFIHKILVISFLHGLFFSHFIHCFLILGISTNFFKKACDQWKLSSMSRLNFAVLKCYGFSMKIKRIWLLSWKDFSEKSIKLFQREKNHKKNNLSPYRWNGCSQSEHIGLVFNVHHHDVYTLNAQNDFFHDVNPIIT